MGFWRLLHGRRDSGFDGTIAHPRPRPDSSIRALRVSPFSITLCRWEWCGLADFSYRSGLDALALLLVWLFVPGTERQTITMEEMNYVFGVATRQHMRYQRDKVGPWFYRRYILWQNVDDPEPLYRYARMKEANSRRE